MNPALARIRWKVILTSLVALVASLGFFYLGGWVYAFSDDECSWRVQTIPGQKGARVIIRELIPDGVTEQAGVLEGDELVAIQGKKVEPTIPGTLVAQQQINDQAEGRVLLYTLRRNGEILQVPVRLVKPFNLAALLLLLTGLTAWLVGLVVVLSSPQRKISRQFYYLGITVLLLPLISSGFIGNLPIPLNILRLVLGNAAGGLLLPLWVHFFLRFPYPSPLRKRTGLIKGLYLFGIAQAAYGICIGFITPLPGDPLRAFAERLDLDQALALLRGAILTPWLRIPVNITALVALGVGVGYLWAGAFRLPRKRRSALIPALVVTAALAADFIVFQYLALKPEHRGSLLFQRQIWVFLLPLPLLPLAFAYGVVRQGLFDVRKAILRWISYFAVLGTVVVLYLGGISALFAYGFQSIPPVWMGAILGLTALPIGWVLRALLLWLRRRFHRDLATIREVVLGSLRETKKRFNQDALLESLRKALEEGFRPQRLDILPVEDEAIVLPAVTTQLDHHPARRLKLPRGLLRHARENRELVVGLGSDEAEWIGEQGAELRAHVDALEAQVLVLVPVQDAIAKALLLGGKYAELNYGREDRELLREAAIVCGIVLETAVMHDKLLKQGRIEQELQTARRIQESLITSQPPDVPGFQMALRLEPALETGGDLLWVKRRPSGRWLAAVGDVSGKGMAAALYMSQAMALLEFATQRAERPLEEILVDLDEALRHLMSQRDFLTLTLLEWGEDGRFRLTRAGHPPALKVRSGKPEDVEDLTPFGRGLGMRPAGPQDWRILEGELAPREWLVLYSDGLTEAMDQQGQLFGTERLKEQVCRVWGTGSPRAAVESVFRDVAAFETQNRDDRTILILGREAP